MKLHRNFSDVFCSLIEAFVTGTAIPNKPHPTLQSAISRQHEIGFEFLVCGFGFVAFDWKRALKESGAQHAKSKMATRLQFLWNDVIDPLWTARNDILHRAANYTTTLEFEQQGQHLQWYHEHGHVLAHQDHYLA